MNAETRKTIKYTELVDIVKTHFDPKPSSIVQRFKFYNRIRAKGESITTYVAALRALAGYCEYGDSLNIMLRDKLACGINHEGIQCRLLSERDLTYDKALEIALAMEAAAKDTKDLQAASNPPPLGLNYVAGGNNSKKRSGKATQLLYRRPQNLQSKPHATQGRPNLTCHHCGGPHFASECKIYNEECFRCKKIGYINSL